MRRITLLTNPDVCNLKCPLCFLQQRGHSLDMGEMPLDVAIAAIEKYGDGLEEVIPSTMGEPLLYSKFEPLLNYCEGKGIRLNLTTNGTFPGKWGREEGLNRLLSSCSDIKISALSFEENVNFDEARWKRNVENLLECRRMMEFKGVKNLSTVSLQVTLHRKNISRAESLLHWAESNGVHRIKWNPVVFLSVAPSQMVAEYGLEKSDARKLRETLVSTKLKCGGSLFFSGEPAENRMNGGAGTCPFENEVWILPDGSVQNCPNPERRFGNPQSERSRCENCCMR